MELHCHLLITSFQQYTTAIITLYSEVIRVIELAGSVECGTELILFYHSGFILFIEIHFQNTKTEDGEINISEIYITHHFCKPGEFFVIH